jgi:hypothetical protein
MRRRALVGAAFALVAWGAHAAVSALETARIDRLIEYVASQSQVKFIRNGREYSSKEAAMFLRAKFDKMGEHVSTARQFIEQIATGSSTSGKPYLIRFSDGRTVTAAQFLGAELERMDRKP